MPLITPPIKNIKEVTEPLKEEILNGHVHTIDEMKAWLAAFGLQRCDKRGGNQIYPA